MAGFSSVRSRNLLTIMVPAIIAFLSAYWFRKKRKLKQLPKPDNSSTNNAEDIPTITKTSASLVSCAKANSNDDTKEASVASVARIVSAESNCIPNGHIDCPVQSTLDNGYFYTSEQKSDNVIGANVTASQSNFLNFSIDLQLKTDSDLPKISDSDQCNDSALSLSNAEVIAPDLQDCLLEEEKIVKTVDDISEEIVDLVDCTSPDKVEEMTSDCLSDKEAMPSEVSAANVCSSNDNALVDSSESSQTSMLDFIDSTMQKSSPTSVESPFSQNLDNSSDCDAPSSIGTSSISLSELFSTSPVDSFKEQLQLDVFTDEDASNDSGKGSTLNPEPTSSCSLLSELSDTSSSEAKKVNFRYSCTSNADVLRKQSPDDEHCSNLRDHYSFYKDSNCNAVQQDKKSTDASSEISTSTCSSSSSHANCAPVTDPKSFQLNASNHYVYEFELPQELCGRLIGRLGKHVKFVKERTNATVYIKRHPYNPRYKLAVVEGSRTDVNNAMELLHKKFPTSQFPNVSLAQTNAAVSGLSVPGQASLQRRSLYFYYLLPTPSYIFNSWLQNFTDLLSANSFTQLHLPENSSVDVILSSMVNAGHFFLQQPTHATYPSLRTLDQLMMTCYTQNETPLLLQPIETGIVCAASVTSGWYRAEVMGVSENGEDCEVKFVDYGGYLQLPASSLRQIRGDFTSLPFQASECFLANVQPINAEFGWSTEASAAFEELAQGQILQAIVNYHEDGVPYVYLYRTQGVTSTFINQELVTRGFAKWIDHQ